MNTRMTNYYILQICFPSASPQNYWRKKNHLVVLGLKVESPSAMRGLNTTYYLIGIFVCILVVIVTLCACYKCLYIESHVSLSNLRSALV